MGATTQTLRLSDFLVAREREPWEHDPEGLVPDDVWHRLLLVQVMLLSAALRAVVWVMLDTNPLTRWVLRGVAAEYADHPDYRQEWRP